MCVFDCHVCLFRDVSGNFGNHEANSKRSEVAVLDLNMVESGQGAEPLPTVCKALCQDFAQRADNLLMFILPPANEIHPWEPSLFQELAGLKTKKLYCQLSQPDPRLL